MLKFELRKDDGILVVTPSGPLEAPDFGRLAHAVDPFVKAELKHFDFCDRDAALAWLRQARETKTGTAGKSAA